MKIWFILTLGIFLFSIGDLSGAPPSGYKVISVTNGGTIRGVVVVEGNVGAFEPLEVSKDPKVCGSSTPVPRLETGKGNGVKNSIIFLGEIHEGRKFQNEEPVLDQRGCVYKPHVLLVPTGSQMEITNSDPILHNVHVYDMEDGLKTLFNIAQPLKGQKTPIKPSLFKHDGLFVATCDAGHPWMNAYIMVSEHPYYTISDADGKFVIDQIPPGTYSLSMWHEGIKVTNKTMENGKVKSYFFEEPYESRQQVSVTAGRETFVSFKLVLR